MDYDQPDMTVLISGILRSPLNQEMSFRLQGALDVTDGLWNLVPIVVAAGEQHDRRSPAETADASPAGLRLSPENRAKVRATGDALLAMQEEELDKQQFDEPAVSGFTMREAAADPFGILGRVMNVPAQAELMGKAIGQMTALTGDEMFYFSAYVRAASKDSRTPMLLRALFATAVGTIEPLVTRLVMLLLYHSVPGRYASLADPELDKEARKRCYGPPDKWRKALRDLGVTSVDAVVDWNRLSDLWEDRNVVAHRGSVTDSRHSIKTGTEEGAVITPDAAAVRSVIDVIGGTRYALVTCGWERLDHNMGVYAAQAADGPICESLRANRWEQAEVLGRLQEQLLSGTPEQATGRVHRWLAVEGGHGPEAIRAEVEAWDTSDLPDEYALARLVLLRNDEEALAALETLLATGGIMQEHLDSWPLFDRLRDRRVLPVPDHRTGFSKGTR